MDNVSFRANININHAKIKECMMFDAHFNKPQKNDLKNTLKEIELLAAMKEKSTVELNPRLDNNQLNLICNVFDKTKKIKTTVIERSGRKIASDENFAKRFVTNIAKAIKNVDITRKSLKKINKVIKESETLEDKNFVSSLPFQMIEYLNKGKNPTKRIISLLKQIDKEYPGEKNIISINNKRSSHGYTSTFFELKNSKGERRIPLHTLLKDPADNLFA